MLQGAGMNWVPPAPAAPAQGNAGNPDIINRLLLAQAQTPAMGYNAPHNRFGGGGNPGVR
jgi:hypothetical protein